MLVQTRDVCEGIHIGVVFKLARVDAIRPHTCAMLARRLRMDLGFRLALDLGRTRTGTWRAAIFATQMGKRDWRIYRDFANVVIVKM